METWEQLHADDTMVFDPLDLDIDVTPDNVKRTLSRGEYVKALALAFRLSERPLIKCGRGWLGVLAYRSYSSKGGPRKTKPISVGDVQRQRHPCTVH